MRMPVSPSPVTPAIAVPTGFTARPGPFPTAMQIVGARPSQESDGSIGSRQAYCEADGVV